MQTLIREIRGFLGALFVVLVIRTFLLQPFVIPSGSMYPALQIGDFIVVTKFTYGFSNCSFPFSPDLFNGRILELSNPERGQVIVHRNPVNETKSLIKKLMFQDESLDYIKRLVGLPGDRIQVKEGILHINGQAATYEKIGDYMYDDPRARENPRIKPHNIAVEYKETLPTGESHMILKSEPFGQGQLDNTPEYIVPEGHYFFMGDNRDNSLDSRVPEVLGFVPLDHLIGPAKLIFFSTEAKWYEPTYWITGIRPSRIFKPIH